MLKFWRQMVEWARHDYVCHTMVEQFRRHFTNEDEILIAGFAYQMKRIKELEKMVNDCHSLHVKPILIRSKE